MIAYTTIQNQEDDSLPTIKLSAILDVNTMSLSSSAVYSMPGIEKNDEKKSLLWWDSEEWIIDSLLPALRRFEDSEDRAEVDTLLEEDKEKLSDEELLDLIPMIDEAIRLGFFQSFGRKPEHMKRK